MRKYEDTRQRDQAHDYNEKGGGLEGLQDMNLDTQGVLAAAVVFLFCYLRPSQHHQSHIGDS